MGLERAHLIQAAVSQCQPVYAACGRSAELCDFFCTGGARVCAILHILRKRCTRMRKRVATRHGAAHACAPCQLHALSGAQRGAGAREDRVEVQLNGPL